MKTDNFWKLIALLALACLNGLVASLYLRDAGLSVPQTASDAFGLILGVANALFFFWASFESLMTWRGR